MSHCISFSTFLQSVILNVANERRKFALLLKSALEAEGMVGLKMNVPKDKVKEIIKYLPALRKPTITMLIENNWCSIESILPEVKVKSIISKIRTLGAEGIVEYPLNKVIY